jgi:hypothetical protein
MQAGDHGAHRPRGHVDPLRPIRRWPATPSHSRVQRGADSPAAAPRTPEACLSGHLDAPDAWTPDAWTLDVRSTGWTDVLTTGLGARTGQRPAWAASGHILATGDHPLGGPTWPGSRRLGALGHPGRLRGDGTCTAALTAAATGQLPSTALDAAPRRTALLGSDGWSVERTATLHPLWQVQLSKARAREGDAEATMN